MQAVGVFPGSREVRMVEHPEPGIRSDSDVKLRMLEVGVCGTDRNLCNFQFGSAPAGSDHFILGHESLAEVVDAGDRVTGLRTDDLVVCAVRKPCSEPGCKPCRAGRQDFCATGRYFEHGIQASHGFMTEFVVEEQRYLYPVPPTLRRSAVLIEPLTIAEKAFLEFQAIDARLPWPKGPGTAVVLGAGPVGILGAMLFQNARFQTWVYSRARAPNPKAAIVESIGARYVSALETPPRAFEAVTGSIDVVYEAMGAPQAAFDIVPLLGPNGVFVFTGVPAPSEPLSLDLHRVLLHLIVRNQVVMGTVNAGDDAFHCAVRDLATFQSRWPGAVTGLITGRYPLPSFRDALYGGGIKNVIEIGR